MDARRALELIVAVLAVSACAREAEPLPVGAPIVIVVVDTLRADALGLYGNAHATSEGLDRWAESGAVFERAFATASWTLPSFVSLFTGRYPGNHGSGRRAPAQDGAQEKVEFVGFEGSMPRLATSLSKAGYATAAFVTNSFLRPGFGFNKGFDRYDFFRSKDRDERRADAMVAHALAWIDAQEPGKPWFCLVHLFDPHLPYDPPRSAAGRFTAGYRGALTAPIDVKSGLVGKVNGGELALDEADGAFLRGLYDEEVSFVAQELASLLDGLAARHVLERGLVLITSDHGEEFLEHGKLEHGHTMYQELLHIPFLAWGRGVQAGRHDEPVSLADVLPTILEATGLPREEGLDGASLWPLLSGSGALAPRALLAENSLYGEQARALLEWPYKLIASPARLQLYDLEQDPAERVDLASTRPELAARLAAALAQHKAFGSERAAVELDAEVQAELRKVGYLGEDADEDDTPEEQPPREDESEEER